MKISVIIPFREKNKKVLNCIKSVKEQNYKNIEIIALSDKIKLKVGGVRSFYNPEWKGVGEKRNFGAKASKGEILFFLDSDCVLQKDALKATY